MHIFHKWTKWELTTAVFRYAFSKSDVEEQVQVRRCEECGYVQTKRVY